MPHEKMRLQGNWFPASVVNNNDPDKKAKVKVRVPAIDDALTDAQIPWAVPMGPAGESKWSGLTIPPVGAGVFVYFPREDMHFRYYMGSNTLGGAAELAKLVEDYPYGHVSVDPMGMTIIANYKKGTYSVGFPDGNGMSWSRESSAVSIKGGKVLVDGGQLASLKADSVLIEGDSQLVLGSPDIQIRGPVTQTGGGSAGASSVPTMKTAQPSYPPPFTQRVNPAPTSTDVNGPGE